MKGPKSVSDPDVRHVLYSSFLIFTAILGTGFIIPFLPSFSKRFGDEFSVGLIYSGFAFARLFAVPLSSLISDRIGRKPVVILGLMLYSVTSFLYVHAWDVASLFVIRVLHGLASSMVIPVCFAYALDHTRPGREGFSVGMVGGSLFLGLGLGPLVGGFVGERFGENYAFYFMGFMGILALSHAVLLMRDIKGGIPGFHGGMTNPLKDILISRIFLLSFFLWFLVMFQRGAVISYFPLLMEKRGFGKLHTGGLLTMYSLISSALQYISGRFIDRFRDKFTPSFILGVLSYVSLIPIRSETTWVVLVSAVTSGILSSLVYPLVMAELGSEAKRKSSIGGTIGFMDWAFSFGNILGPVIMGVVVERIGVASMFVILGIFGSSLFLVLLWFHERTKVSSK